MDKTQLLSIELGTACNLATEHPECPSRHPERYRHLSTVKKLDDATIIGLVQSMYRIFGFRGLVAWHYYNEPLLKQARMFNLMEQIKARVAEARFLLWTNGTLLPTTLEPFRAFDRIVITDYGNLDNDLAKRLAVQQPGVTIHRWPLDNRLDIAGEATDAPCGRMFVEFIVDAFGNVHLCCYAWKGQATPGNVFTTPLQQIVAQWQRIRDDISGVKMAKRAPDVCRRCNCKHPNVVPLLPPCVAAPEVVEAAKQYIAGLRTPPSPLPPPAPITIQPAEQPAATPIAEKATQLPLPEVKLRARKRHRMRRIAGRIARAMRNRRLAVVFVSYLRVPEKRLQDHFAWNDALYRRTGAHVYVVTDCEHDLPRYAECVLFPEDRLPLLNGKPVFSLCATKNAGIRKALADGAEIIVAADVDHAFPEKTWEQFRELDDAHASVPVYVMVPTYDARTSGWKDTGATGVIAMTAANWGKIRWDERCIGYGADDGIILSDMKAEGISLLRDKTVWHIEHPGAEAAKNVPGRGRAGCYGREDGFNPDNFSENRKLHRMRQKARK